jgi:hypothetical protein
MPPAPKIRKSYASDAAFMARLQSSIARDPDLTGEERKELSKGLADVGGILMQVDSRRAEEKAGNEE